MIRRDVGSFVVLPMAVDTFAWRTQVHLIDMAFGTCRCLMRATKRIDRMCDMRRRKTEVAVTHGAVVEFDRVNGVCHAHRLMTMTRMTICRRTEVDTLPVARFTSRQTMGATQSKPSCRVIKACRSPLELLVAVSTHRAQSLVVHIIFDMTFGTQWPEPRQNSILRMTPSTRDGVVRPHQAK